MKRTLVAPANPMLSRNLLLLFFIAFATLLSAQASLSVQGVLAKSDGSAVDDGEYTLTFRLWDAATGGVKVHQETITNVETTGGVYSVALGTNGTPMTAPFDKVYYLGVSIGSSSTELLPRPVLTHAPYALSLLGQTNQFPSTGVVSADAIKVPGGAPSINFANKGYSFGTGGDPDGGLFSLYDNNVAIYANGNKALEAADTMLKVIAPLRVQSGAVINDGIFLTGGGCKLNTFLTINGNVNSDNEKFVFTKPIEVVGAPISKTVYGDYSRLWDDDINTSIDGSSNTNYVLNVQGNVIAYSFYAISDRRIKKDFQATSTAESLAKLLRLRVTDYRYIDDVARGRGMEKGFVAQEVEEVESNAVSRGTNFLPSIYALANQIAADAGFLQITLNKPHELKPNDRVRIFDGHEQHDATVASVGSEQQFSVETWAKTPPAQLFVYGKEVSDFRTVDYDHIFTMNVAATQELARRLEILENENAALRSKVERQSALESQVAELARRLNLIENSGATGMRK